MILIDRTQQPLMRHLDYNRWNKLVRKKAAYIATTSQGWYTKISCKLSLIQALTLKPLLRALQKVFFEDLSFKREGWGKGKKSNFP